MSKQACQAEIMKCNNVKEIFDTLHKYYDLENCKPGVGVKAGLVLGLEKAITMTGAKLRVQK